MGRPKGTRIIETVELLERLGPSTAVAITPHLPEPARPNVRNLLSRAWAHGLATWYTGSDGRRIYSVVADWREHLEPVKKEKMVKAPRPEPRRFNSVWAFAAS
jgi:hypothetical protein